jgi:PAS domain S-box-containing protein
MLSPRTVLVIEDSPEDRESYRRALSQGSDYVFLEAELGEDALLYCAQTQPDAILLDFCLPDMDGLEFLAQLQRQQGEQHPPVVMITGQGDETVAVQAMKAGASDYLVKGKTDADTLKRSLDNTIETTKLRQQLRASEQRFHTSVENMLDCFGIFSAVRDEAGQIIDFRIDYLNTPALESMQLTKDHIGQRLGDLFRIDRETGLFQDCCQLVETGVPLVKVTCLDTGMLGSQQETKAYDIRANRLDDGFVAWWRDVTERQKMEAERAELLTLEQAARLAAERNIQQYRLLAERLRDNERRFRGIFNSAFQYIALLSTSGCLLEANQTALEFAELTAAEVLDRLFWETPWWTLSVETQQQLQTAIQQAAAGEFVRYDVTIAGAGGQVASIDFSIKPVQDEAGAVVLLIAEGRDISELKRSQQALQQSAEQLKIAQRAAKAGLWSRDLATDQTFWSEEYYLLYGLDPTTPASYDQWLASIVPEDRARVNQIARQESAEDEPVHIEFRIHHPNLGLRWIESIGQTVCDADGNPRSITGMALDITDRKQTEQLLTQQAHLLELIREAVIVRDCQGRISYWSRGAEKEYGWTQAEALGQTTHTLLQTQPFLGGFALDEHLSHTEYWEGELIHTCRDGHQITVESRQVLVRDEQGQPSGFLEVNRNITARKQAEAALRASEAKFRRIADSNLVGIFFADYAGQVYEANTAFLNMVQYTQAELQAGELNWQRLTPPKYEWQMKPVEKQLREYGVVAPFEKTYLRRDGTLLPVLLGIATIDTEGPEGYSVCFALDLTELKQTEQALRESEERFRALATSAPIGIFLSDAQGRTIFTNPMWQTISGLNAEASLGWGWSEVIHPDDRQVFLEHWQQALTETQSSWQQEVRLLTPQGETRWIRTLANPSYAPTGELLGYVGTVEDITERKLDKAALMQQEQRYRYIFEATGVSIWEEDFSEVKGAIDALKAQGVTDFRQYFDQHPEFVQQMLDRVKILNVNEMAVQMCEADSKEHLLTSLHQVFLPETMTVFVNELLTLAADKNFYSTETKMKTLKGRSFDVLLSLTFPPPTDSYDRVLVSCMDITDRTAAIAALYQSEQRYRLLADNVPNIVWINDLEGYVVYVNSRWSEYTGLAQEEALGQGWQRTIHPEDLPSIQAFWANLSSERPTSYEVEYRLKGAVGGFRWFLARGVAIRDDRGQPVQWFGTSTDIHDKKELEATRAAILEREQEARAIAEAANRTKDEFLAIVSHELRSPLNAILGWTQVLQKRDFDPATIRRALESIERNAQTQVKLVEELLDVSRIVRGTLQLTKSKVCPVALVELAVSDVRPAATAKHIQLQVTQSGEIGLIEGDLNRLHQVLANLLSNAIKFTPSGGQIEVIVSQVDSQSQIQVKDTGAGIAPEFLPHIFDPFRQAESATRRSAEGLGLGLAIVQRLVQLHDGTVTAESAGPGQGSTFTVLLPLQPQTETGQTNCNQLN